MWRDIRFVARLLAKDAPFTVMAVLALALGIGASMTVFVLVNAALLRNLPFRRHDRLLDVAAREARGREEGISYLDYRDLQTARAFESLAASSDTAIDISEEAR